jgi:hypothetical protein
VTPVPHDWETPVRPERRCQLRYRMAMCLMLAQSLVRCIDRLRPPSKAAIARLNHAQLARKATIDITIRLFKRREPTKQRVREL